VTQRLQDEHNKHSDLILGFWGDDDTKISENEEARPLLNISDLFLEEIEEDDVTDPLLNVRDLFLEGS
jgi:hypothetical protein